MAAAVSLFRPLKSFTSYDIKTFQIWTLLSQGFFLLGFQDFFVSNNVIHSSSTRQATYFQCTFSCSALGQFSIKFRGPSI